MQTMTIRELIEILSALDQNAIVPHPVQLVPGFCAAKAGYPEHFLEEAGLRAWEERCKQDRITGGFVPSVRLNIESEEE